jgi:hypothetical protein
MFRSRYLLHYQCPDCGGSEAYRSRRRTFLEKYVLPLLLLRPVRCAKCFRKTRASILVQVRSRENNTPEERSAAA